MDFDHALHNMVAQQLERRGIRDSRVLEAMDWVRREEFVPPELADLAYDDRALPIGLEHGSNLGAWRRIRLRDVSPAHHRLLASLASGISGRLEAQFVDLDPPRRPPDLPAAIVRLRVVAGGKPQAIRPTPFTS